MRWGIAMVMLIIILFILNVTSVRAKVPNDLEDKFHQFNHEYARMWWLLQSADWNFSTNVTRATAYAQKYASIAYGEWMRNWKLWAREINTSSLPPHQKQTLRTMASGVVFMKEEDTRLVSVLKSRLTRNYCTVRVLNASSESEVIALFSQLRDPDALKEVWKSWRLQVADKSKKAYLKLVQVTNNASRQNGYSDVGDAWREELGIDDVMTTVLCLWNDVKDFYKELHAYTKHKLLSLYGEEHIKSEKGIPAHLLGSLWGENWSALYDILKPYPNKTSIDITSSLLSEGYTVLDLVFKAEEFYSTMGLDNMKLKFLSNSMFVKPKDRLVDCHAVSYDFALNDDYRIRMCAEVNERNFFEMIHELGHVHYYMAYHHLPMIMRSGANSAFHEAVGETMVYAAQSPKCLQVLNIQSFQPSEELTLNTLMKQALSKFVLLPWALTVEIWRYSLFSGQINENDMMSKWWELRKQFQGIEPPDAESAMLFDPISKYHVALHIPYMRYFLSRFLEHQFLEALCAGENIHDCCFITSSEAGTKLKHMLSLGASVPWPDALQALTGSRQLSSSPIMNYYKPLYHWLVKYNALNKIEKAW